MQCNQSIQILMNKNQRQPNIGLAATKVSPNDQRINQNHHQFDNDQKLQIDTRIQSIKRVTKAHSARLRQNPGPMILNFIRRLDMFGIHINMTYEGHESFKTLFGAIMSIIVGLLVISFFTYKSTLMLNRMDAKTSKQSFVKNLKYEPPMYVHNMGFNFAFTANIAPDPKYGQFSLNYINVTYINSTSQGRLKIITPLILQTCTKELFGLRDDEEFYSAGLSTYLCVSRQSNLTDLPLVGDYYSKQFTYFQLNFERCMNSSSNNYSCKPLDEIDVWMSQNKISLAFINNYFDFKKFGNEIQSYIDDSIFFELEKSTRKMINIYVQRNEAVLKDDMIQYGQQKTYDYYTVENKETYTDDFAAQNKGYMTMYFRIDKKYDIQRREIYSLGSLLGEIGGLSGALANVSSLIVWILVQKYLYTSIASKLYRVEKRPHLTCINNHNQDSEGDDEASENDIEKQQVAQKKKITEGEQFTDHIKKHQGSISSKFLNKLSGRKNNNNSPEINNVRGVAIPKIPITLDEKTNLDKVDQAFLVKELQNRSLFKPHLFDFFGFIGTCLCIRRVFRGDQKKHVLIKRASKLVSNDLNVVNIIKQLKRAKFLFYNMLEHHKRFMFYYQRDHLINPEDVFQDQDKLNGKVSSDDNSDFDYDNICKEVRNYRKELSLTSQDKKIIEGIYLKTKSIKQELKLSKHKRIGNNPNDTSQLQAYPSLDRLIKANDHHYLNYQASSQRTNQVDQSIHESQHSKRCLNEDFETFSMVGRERQRQILEQNKHCEDSDSMAIPPKVKEKKRNTSSSRRYEQGNDYTKFKEGIIPQQILIKQEFNNFSYLAPHSTNNNKPPEKIKNRAKRNTSQGAASRLEKYLQQTMTQNAKIQPSDAD